VSVDWQDAGDVPTALKWGATETAELFVGGSPYQWIDTDGVDEAGVGDPVVGGRWRFLELVPEHPAAALQFEAKLPLGDDDLSTGETDYLASFILDAAVGHVGLTAFYQVGALGEEGSSDFDVLHLVALGTGVPIHGALAGYGELAWSEIPEQDVEAGFVQAGVYYTTSSAVVYDAGLSLGFGPDAPDVIFLVGFTKNLGRL